VLPGMPVYEEVIGYLAILLGALSWWFGITFFVSKVRTRFNLRGIWLINRIIGGVVMVVSLLGFIFTLLGASFY
jgi:membrane-anchored protein YejM (alkaline phosphatase superfamily)